MREIVHQTVSESSPGDSTAAAASGQFLNLKRFDWFIVDANIQGATGDTLDIYLQRDVDGTWVDWYHFAQLSAGASATRVMFDSKMSTDIEPVTVGADASPALAVDTLAGAHPGDKVRVYFVPGGSTSSGATQTITITGISNKE